MKKEEENDSNIISWSVDSILYSGSIYLSIKLLPKIY